MSIITRMRKQKAVYWAPAGNDGVGGKTFATAVDITCRWVGKQELFIDIDGKEITSRAKVYTSVETVPEGFLYEGEISDLDSDHSDPTIIDGAYEIRSTENLPNIRNTENLLTAWVV